METTVNVQCPATTHSVRTPGADKIDFFASTLVFRGLDRDTLGDLERRCHYRRFAPQEQILDHGECTTDVFFLIGGRIRIVNFSVSGREIAFDELAPGSVFGELSAIDGGPRSAGVVAITDTHLAIMPGPLFVDTILKYPSAALAVMQRLTAIIRTADERIMDLSTMAAQSRVQAELLRQAKRHMVDVTTSRIQPIPLHGDIASRISTTRESVARVMNDLARKGIVKRTKDALIVHDVERLEKMVEDVRG
ncbi:MAG: Crp/Fnr family transcriptional regulator [Rhodospirillales bacterium]|nr:Crp/Fnr family transcriptional regulator [Rhodospirillales bacterium]